MYNKGKTLVVSKVPLPSYRADLDDRHGSTQKEVKTSNYMELECLCWVKISHLIVLQIRMSTETERRVGNLLDSSQRVAHSNDSGVKSGQGARQSSSCVKIIEPVSTMETNSAKEKLGIELKQRQDKIKVDNQIFFC